jgi:hypothetical protein
MMMMMMMIIIIIIIIIIIHVQLPERAGIAQWYSSGLWAG